MNLNHSELQQVKRTDFRGIKLDSNSNARQITRIPDTYLGQKNHWEIKLERGDSIIKAMQQLETKLLGISHEALPEVVNEQSFKK